MKEEKYQESVSLAHLILDRSPTHLDAATCLYTIGYAKRVLGEVEGALPYLLEAVTRFPATDAVLIAHTQDEIARCQFERKHIQSAIFFIEMAIDNFTAVGFIEMKDACETFREDIRKETGS